MYLLSDNEKRGIGSIKILNLVAVRPAAVQLVNRYFIVVTCVTVPRKNAINIVIYFVSHKLLNVVLDDKG
jgi:hypothetical protein